MPSPTSEKAPRLSSEARREQIVLAAIAVFGARGYVGTTTDDVAKAAGVSQPYVVRLFGSKESLFIAAIDETLDRLLHSFRVAIADTRSPLPVDKRIGQAYLGLTEVRGLHQTLLHAFLAGAHPVIGARARDGFVAVWDLFRNEAGMEPDEARGVLADGMLVTTIIALRFVDEYPHDPRVTDLYNACFPTQLAAVLQTSPRADEPW